MGFGLDLGVELAPPRGRKNLRNGGRDRTRTCDLLRVKPENPFYSAPQFLLRPLVFNNLGRLLSLSRQPQTAQSVPF